MDIDEMIEINRVLGDIFEEMIDNQKRSLMQGVRKVKMERCRNEEAKARRQLAIRNGQVYFKGNKTILEVGDEVYVAKCESGDRYDPEKGLMVCVMKAFGFGTKDFLHLLENAKGQPYKEPIKNCKKCLKGDKKR